VAGAAYALERDGNRTRRTDVADEVDGADVDAEFERCGRYQDFYLAFFQFAFGFEAQLAREASVVSGNVFFAKRSPS